MSLLEPYHLVRINDCESDDSGREQIALAQAAFRQNPTANILALQALPDQTVIAGTTRAIIEKLMQLLPEQVLYGEHLGQGGLFEVAGLRKPQTEGPDIHLAKALKVPLKGKLAETASLNWRLIGGKLANLSQKHTDLMTIYGTPTILGSGSGQLIQELRGFQTFDQILRDSTSDQCSPWQITHIALKAAEALQRLHNDEIAHLDLKPGNIFVMNDGQIILGDFDLAQVRQGKNNLTGDRSLRGSPLYIAPEYILQGTESFYRRSDQFALGVILLDLFTDKWNSQNIPKSNIAANLKRVSQLRNLLTEDLDLCLSHYSEIFQVNKNIIQQLIILVLKLTNPDPSQRFESLQEAIDRLAQINQTMPNSNLHQLFEDYEEQCGETLSLAPEANPFNTNGTTVVMPYTSPGSAQFDQAPVQAQQ